MSGGIDTKTAEKHLQPGAGFASLENCVLDKIGKVRKRYGFSEQTITTGTYSVDGGYNIIDADNLYLHRRGVDLATSGRVGRLFSVSGSTSMHVGPCEPISIGVINASGGVAQSTQAANPDAARVSAAKNICIAWREQRAGAASSSIRYSVIDEESMSMVVNSRLVTESLNPTQVRVVSVGSSYCVIAAFVDISGIVMFTIPATAPDGSIVSHAVKSCDAPTCRMNAVSGSYNGTACAVIANTLTYGADRRLELSWVTSAGVVVNTITVAAAPNSPKATTAIGLDRIGDIIIISWVEDTSNDLKYAAYNATNGAVVLDPSVADNTGACSSCSRLTAASDEKNALLIRLYAELLDASPYNYCVHTYEIQRSASSTTPISVTPLRTMERVGIGAKAYSHDYVSRLWTWHDSGYEDVDGVYVQGLQNCYTLERIDRSAPSMRERVVECKAMAGSAASYPSEAAPASTTLILGDGSFCSAMLARRWEMREGSSTNYYVDQIVLLCSTHDVSNTPWVKRGDHAVLAGQVASIHGNHHTPIGYILSPEHVTVSAGAGAGNMSDGTYRYQVFYEWVDDAGCLHRSAASPPVSLQLAGGTAFQSVDITIPIYAAEVPHKLEGMRFAIYRTLSSDPATYYRVGNASAETDGTDTPTVTYTDTLSDATLQDNSQPYTTWEQAAAGGELEAQKPPHASIISSSKDRIMLVPDEDQTCVWVSKPAQTGIAPEFSEYLTIRIEQGGDITGVAEMDGRIVIFKAEEIYVVSGDGVGPTGVGAWSAPERITTDIGCVDARSILRCDKGLLFKSRRGIYLLDRSYQPSYIGAPVESWNEYAVDSAIVYSQLNQCLYAMSYGSENIVLVYDYALNRWSTYTGIIPCAMAVHGGELWYIADDADVYKYDSSTYRDGDPASATDVVLSVTMPWVSGYHRCWWVYVAGGYVSPHRLKVELSYDYNPTVIDTQYISFPSSAEEIVRIMPSRQWSLAVRAKISIIKLDDDTVLGCGAYLDAVEYHVGIGPERSWPISQSRSK